MDSFKLRGEVRQDSTFKGNRERTVKTYEHLPSGLKVVFCDIEGPLCGASVVVLTECDNDKGLPHTLEHLVFCGSARYPDRGFLDTLATRCLTDGTNAWTSDDHTAYTVETVGSKGMENILPVFLDHVFHPNLREAQFITEVYHVDGEGKEQGVVFCEMSGCENTEIELMDNEIKKVAYASTGYSFSYGGKMADIATLTNEEIKRYHKRYYFPANVAVILSGMLDPEVILPLIAKVDLAPKIGESERAEPWKTVETKPFAEHISRIVDFPSEDNEVGSVSFAWRGPPVTNLELAVALEILLLFMADSSASPFPQRFVEHDPIASYVGYQYKPYVMSTISINFDGVTIPEHARKTVEDDEEEEDGDDDESESESDDDGPSEGVIESPYSKLPKINKDKLYDEGVFRELVYELLHEITRQLELEGEVPKSIQKALSRYEKKWFEKLEDEPHELVASSVILEMVQMSPAHLKAPFTYAFGQRLNIVGIIRELGKKPTSYWIGLLKEWFIDANCLEVKTMPNPQLAEDISRREQAALEARVKRMGPAGLKKARDALTKAVKENQVNLPEEILARMPPVPPSKDISLLPEVMRLVPKDESSSMSAILVSTSTRFCHLRLCLDTSSIPLELRSYLVLFQELLLESDLQLPGGPLLPWAAVVESINEDTVTLECGVGFGNSTFTCSYLSSVFYIYGISEPDSFHLLCRHITNMLFFTKFSIERVITMAKNLLNDIVEQNREGNEVVEAVMIQKTEQPDSNLKFLSVFHQQPFLKKILKKLSTKVESSKESYSQVVLGNLEKIREHLLGNMLSQAYCQLSTAQGDDGEAKLKQFLDHWNRQLEIFAQEKQAARPRPQRKKTKSSASAAESSSQRLSPWPACRVSYSPVKREIAICVPVEGLDVSYLSSLVPCETLLTPDYYPVLVLAEVLSGTEGPLYTAIRGQGLAYGAGISIYKWYGQIAFNVREASSPDKALECFHEILSSIPSKASKILSDFAIETAKAAVTFRLYSQRTTPVQVIGKVLENTLMGFETLEQERKAREQMALVTRDDILRVYHKYFVSFLEGVGRVTVLTTGPKNVKKYVKNFALKPLGIRLETKTLKQLSS